MVEDLQSRQITVAGRMPTLGPNAVGLVNYLDPIVVMMDHFGVYHVEHGVSTVSQGSALLCDAVFSDRRLPITHMVGCGNQAISGAEASADFLLDDPRVRAVSQSFEGPSGACDAGMGCSWCHAHRPSQRHRFRATALR